MDSTLPSPVGSLLNVTATRMKLLVTDGRRYPGRQATFDITDTRSPAVCQRLVDLLSEHARVSYQFCVLADAPWQVLFSSFRQSYLPYFERAFALIAFCDPVGPQKDREALLEQFYALARGKGKHAVILMGTESAREAAERLGFAGFWVGTEAMVDLAGYAQVGKTGRKLRQEANHIAHLGGTAREIFPLNDSADRQAIEELVQQWKAHLHRRYITSFLGTKPMENAHFRRYFTVEAPDDPTGSPVMQSLLVCSPVSRKGWYLDLVRRPEAPRGATEMAIASAIETFRAEGVEFITLGLVPFYDPTGQQSFSNSGFLLRWGIGYLSRLYHFSGMQMFRAKFTSTRAESAYVLFFPPILTPQVMWEAASVLTMDAKMSADGKR